MAERPRAIGRGLAAILSSSPSSALAVSAGEQLHNLPLGAISPNPRQPRRKFAQEALAALAESIKERGVLQPVLVRPLVGGSYELIAGERRWRAAQLAGLTQIPAIVRGEDDAGALEIALIENMAREDLNPVEEARACAALVEGLGLTREEVGRRVGRSRVAISNLIRLLDLPDEALEMLENATLTPGHGRALLTAADHGTRRRLAREAAEGGWSVRELEARARVGAVTPDEQRQRSMKSKPHADQLAAAQEIAEALSGALGAEVAVVATTHGYRVALELGSVQEGLDLAVRISSSKK
ncbi:MAG: ParB/RepB/Spo0J family partition protein [Actinomycetota bacterium]